MKVDLPAFEPLITDLLVEKLKRTIESRGDPMSQSQNTITPRGTSVLFRKHTPASVGGIELPAAAAGQVARFEIIAVGAEVEGLEPGEYILLSPAGRGHLVAVDPDDDDLIMVDEAFVIGDIVYGEASLIKLPVGALA